MCTCEWPCYCAKIEITLQRQTQIMMHVCLCGREEEWIVPKIEINSLSSHFVSTNGCALNLTVSFLVWHWRVQTQLLPQGTRVTAKSPASLSIHLQILSVCLSLMFFIQTFSAPKDNAAIHHTTFKLMLIKPILHFSHVFPALLAKKKKINSRAKYFRRQQLSLREPHEVSCRYFVRDPEIPLQAILLYMSPKHHSFHSNHIWHQLSGTAALWEPGAPRHCTTYSYSGSIGACQPLSEPNTLFNWFIYLFVTFMHWIRGNFVLSFIS